MDREIKFRAWVKKTAYIEDEVMLPVTSIEWDCEGKGHLIYINAVNHDDMDEDWQLKVKDVELMQFTGLKDKNGTEIYEGDILKDVEWKKEMEELKAEFPKEWAEMREKERERLKVSICAPVIFKEGKFSFDENYLKGEQETFCLISMIKTNVVEVIGNIYENPELLKE